MHAAEPSALPACLPARVVERTCAGALQTAVMECGDFKGPCFDQPQTTDPQRPLAAFLPLTGRTHRRHPGSQPRLRHRQPTGILNADHQSITNSIDVDVSSPLPSRTTSSVTSHRAPLLQIPLGQPNHREPPGKPVHRDQLPSIVRRFAVPLLGTVHAASRGRVLVRPTTRQADPGARGCPACSDPTSPYSCPRPRVRQNQKTLIQETGGANDDVGRVLESGHHNGIQCADTGKYQGSWPFACLRRTVYYVCTQYRNPPFPRPSHLNIGKLSSPPCPHVYPAASSCRVVNNRSTI